jgi:hypothetical protein
MKLISQAKLLKEAAEIFLEDPLKSSSEKQRVLELLDLISRARFSRCFIETEILLAELNFIIKCISGIQFDYGELLFQGPTVEQRCRLLEFLLPVACSLRFTALDKCSPKITDEELDVFAQKVQAIAEVSLRCHYDDQRLFRFLGSVRIDKLLLHGGFYGHKENINLLLELLQSSPAIKTIEFLLSANPKILHALESSSHLKHLKIRFFNRHVQSSLIQFLQRNESLEQLTMSLDEDLPGNNLVTHEYY